MCSLGEWQIRRKLTKTTKIDSFSLISQYRGRWQINSCHFFGVSCCIFHTYYTTSRMVYVNSFPLENITIKKTVVYVGMWVWCNKIFGYYIHRFTGALNIIAHNRYNIMNIFIVVASGGLSVVGVYFSFHWKCGENDIYCMFPENIIVIGLKSTNEWFHCCNSDVYCVVNILLLLLLNCWVLDVDKFSISYSVCPGWELDNSLSYFVLLVDVTKLLLNSRCILCTILYGVVYKSYR